MKARQRKQESPPCTGGSMIPPPHPSYTTLPPPSNLSPPALSDPYFSGLLNSEREPSTQPISKLEFDFERKKLTKDDVKELIYREMVKLLTKAVMLREEHQLMWLQP
ncbi:hypothetical protein N665_0242s0018 [Sinapis alba]|nr:hypothetical protein N665_0242s0018 [Sinapis alba]